MNKFLTLSLSAALFAGVATLSNAQEPVASPADAKPRVEEVKDRQAKQEDRIEAGEKSGELTKSEDHKLQKEEKHLQEKKKEDMAKHDGHLTGKEERKLDEKQDKISKDIYKDKHNDSTTSEAKPKTDKAQRSEDKPRGDNARAVSIKHWVTSPAKGQSRAGFVVFTSHSALWLMRHASQALSS